MEHELCKERLFCVNIQDSFLFVSSFIQCITFCITELLEFQHSVLIQVNTHYHL